MICFLSYIGPQGRRHRSLQDQGRHGVRPQEAGRIGLPQSLREEPHQRKFPSPPSLSFPLHRRPELRRLPPVLLSPPAAAGGGARTCFFLLLVVLGCESVLEDPARASVVVLYVRSASFRLFCRLHCSSSTQAFRYDFVEAQIIYFVYQSS